MDNQVPDTSRVAALQCAQHLSIPYREGFVKNRYIGRTFIMPGQTQRRRNVRKKLNAMPMEFQDKVVMLVDDSIVRGTTSKEIVQMAKDAGAKKVVFASCAPPIRSVPFHYLLCCVVLASPTDCLVQVLKRLRY